MNQTADRRHLPRSVLESKQAHRPDALGRRRGSRAVTTTVGLGIGGLTLRLQQELVVGLLTGADETTVLRCAHALGYDLTDPDTSC